MAQDASAALLKHLATTRPSNRTNFESHLVDAPELWQQLQYFEAATHPVLLWYENGKYASLFRFLAHRFLLAPDHILDAERIPARWLMACALKRGMHIMTLNASLRVMH